MDKEDLIHSSRATTMPEVIRCSCHISLILVNTCFVAPLTFRFTRESQPTPTCFIWRHLQSQRRYSKSVDNRENGFQFSFLQEESCRPAVRYHVKLLLPFLLSLADSKESKSLMADRRTLRDPGQNLSHRLRRRPNPRCSSLIHRCWSCSRSCLECYDDKYYIIALNVLPVDTIRIYRNLACCHVF